MPIGALTQGYLRRLAAVFVCLGLIALAVRQARAHELAIDRVALWPDRTAGQLRGQVSFDPELTRDLAAPADRALSERRVREFLQQQLAIVLNDRECTASFQVRELYTRGGAVPGDIVMLSCPLPGRLERVLVRVGPALGTLVVTLSGFGSDPAPRSVLVQGGSASPIYFVEQPTSSAWRAGGAEQFAAPQASASAPAKSTASAPPSVPAEPAGFAPERPLDVVVRYVAVGFRHILPLGWDHVCFVLGLTLGRSRQLRRLLLELTCFTLAHTLTLGLGALGVTLIPSAVVEPLIALSIVCIGGFNLFPAARNAPRLALVFAFGLVHGQGFAGALLGSFLRADALVAALLGFNLGVELGQAAVVLVLWALLRLVPARFERHGVVIPLSLVTIAVGSYFVFERIFGS